VDDLASTIAKMVSRTPGGVLIFFPSYKMMNDTYVRWQNAGGLSEIQAHK
jgi:Rad3-related DNA helicase